MTWRPDDDELDAVARTLDANVPTREVAEQLRTSVLASAAARPQRSRRSFVPFVVASVALAAAAAIALWSGRSASAKQEITSHGVARFVRVTGWPDFVVRLDDGRIAVKVATLDTAERFRITTLDAEVEVRGARFEISADHDRLQSVLVQDGRVEIRPKDQHVVILSAGESWNGSRLVQREETIIPPVVAPVPVAPVAAVAPPVVTSAPLPKPPHVARPPAPAVSSPLVEQVEPIILRAGEAEFRAGMAALRTGDPAAAAKAFSTACTEAQHEPIGEDACFWTGAAAKRAGDTATARSALERFLKQFPTSVRANEASALLGWLLFDAGDLDAAERDFHRAEHDRVPKVRDSAQRGLTAIQRKRT